MCTLFVTIIQDAYNRMFEVDKVYQIWGILLVKVIQDAYNTRANVDDMHRTCANSL